MASSNPREERPDQTSGRDECVHGSLRRKCEICERDIEIAALRAALQPFAAVYADLLAIHRDVETGEVDADDLPRGDDPADPLMRWGDFQRAHEAINERPGLDDWLVLAEAAIRFGFSKSAEGFNGEIDWDFDGIDTAAWAEEFLRGRVGISRDGKDVWLVTEQFGTIDGEEHERIVGVCATEERAERLHRATLDRPQAPNVRWHEVYVTQEDLLT